MRAVAQAVMEDVRGSLQSIDPPGPLAAAAGGGAGAAVADEAAAADLAARAELASETAGALLAGTRNGGARRGWAPWAWAWGFGSWGGGKDAAAAGGEGGQRAQAQRLADFLDPIRAFLSLRAPTLRSK